MTSSRSAWHISLIYMVVATLWILFSDKVLLWMGVEVITQQRLQTIKGLVFVVVTGALLFYSTRHHLRGRQQQEQALRHSEERFDLALLGSNDGVWDWDMVSGELYFSDRCKLILGHPPEFNMNQQDTWLKHLHPEDRLSLQAELRRHIRGETERLDHVHRIRRRDGFYAWVQARGQAVRNAQGRAIRMVGIVCDVTQQKLDNERLQQAAVVFDSTNEGVVVSDSRNRITNVNNAFCRITGYTHDEVVGQKPGLLKSGWHDELFYREMWETLAHTGSWQGEIWNRRKDGEIYPQWQAINTVKDSSGKLTHYVAVFSDISVLKQSRQEIDFLAHHDPLTRLPNRLLLTERLTNALVRAKRREHRLGLIFIDLDRFKTVNDSLGHTAGDELLRQAAKRMSRLCREEDTLARLGGDEFVMLVENLAETDDITPIAQRLQRGFARPFDINGQLIHLSASLGMSIFPEDGQEGGELLTNADAAVTQAKQNGRNTYAFYTQALTNNARLQMSLQADLHRAIKLHQLQVFYQPQIDMHSGRVIALEALVRWQHPQRGLIPPAEFLPVAQHVGLLIPIDEYVLQQACLQMRQWLDAGYPLTCVAVNMSGSTLERGDVVSNVKKALAGANLPAAHLELELTESEIMQQDDRCIDTLDALRGMGVRLSIDDFGTGYSSLLRLKRLPVDTLKIDRGFINDLPGSANDSAISRAIIALGQSLQMSIVAEGIETQAQHDLLREMKCDVGQGYLYSKPQDVTTITAYLLDHFSAELK
ncbi:EAL domain-containing protein [Halopseudomonas laoshanensis]|uniref:cyclic-guanylate-specific phosphodiesterase n=1 Tax=Halopseudomonas laoshanensis TaxID=2268758 RepID=A0A7V7GSL0_9GAMM|nr:EAL domain-containing protein [Halopseudomonas laoshanensis]KAA0693955.1 EAL domain-containing protein [Halopseudomonas laoshanensis]